MWNKCNYKRFLKCQVVGIVYLSSILLLFHLTLILSMFSQHLWLQTGKLFYLTSQHILPAVVDVTIIFSQHHCFHRISLLPVQLSCISVPFSASCRHLFCLTRGRIIPCEGKKKSSHCHLSTLFCPGSRFFLSLFLEIPLYHFVFNSKHKAFRAQNTFFFFWWLSWRHQVILGGTR